jgi:hypothetical protein
MKPHSPPCALNAVVFFRRMLLLKHHSEEAYDDPEQGSTFYQGCSQNHVGTDVIHGFRLAGDAFYSTLTDLANAQSCTNSCQSGTNGTTGIRNGF